MLHKLGSYIDDHIDAFLSAKNFYMVFITVILLVLSVFMDNLKERHAIAVRYIQELEEAIEADGTVVGDVCGGDGYCGWYNN